MYKDLISYELAEHVTKEHLLKVSEQIVNDWMKKLPGFIHWEINELKDGSFIDIVYWETEADAKHAEKEMVNIPNAADWYGCYKEGTIKGKHLFLVAKF